MVFQVHHTPYRIWNQKVDFITILLVVFQLIFFDKKYKHKLFVEEGLSKQFYHKKAVRKYVFIYERQMKTRVEKVKKYDKAG